MGQLENAGVVSSPRHQAACGNDRITMASEKKPMPRGYTWFESERLPRSKTHRALYFACDDCGLIFPPDTFRPDPRRESGQMNICRACESERRRRWRKDNADRINAGRRLGPFAKTCTDCGREFEAAWRGRARCPECQQAMRKTRKR